MTKLDASRRESAHVWPQFLPDGNRFLYVSHTIAERKNEIWAGSLDGKVHKPILRADSLLGVARSRLYFVNDGAIYAQPFDEDGLAVSGTPQRVVDGVIFSEPGVTAGAGVARDGALLYEPISARMVDLSWYDRNGRRIEKLFAEADLTPASLSHDGTKIAAAKWNQVKGADDIYIIDLVRGIRSRLTAGLSQNMVPIWSPDDSRVYFISDRDGAYDIFVQADDAATPAQVVWKSARDKVLYDVSPDGLFLLANEHDSRTRSDIYLVPVADPAKRRPLVASEANETAAGFSPDGKWIAYTSDHSGRRELYMRPVAGGRSTQITTAGLTGYAWNKDGSEFYVRTTTNERVAIPITYRDGTVVPGQATPLFTPPAVDHSIIAVTEKGFLISSVPDPSDYISVLHYLSSPLD